MKYLSLFSGIEAASVAWHPLGWEPMAFADIEKFPSAVLAERYPDVPNLGDVTTVDWAAWKEANGSPDVMVAGSPCQAFSVAGKRRSLEDARGNLALYTAELVRFLDPRVFVWENVPGVLNTKDNAFGCLLAELAGADTALVPVGRWSDSGLVVGQERRLAWRVLDAQWFGVAQRRRRVFVVACPIDGPDPAAILLECEGVRRDTPPSREPREGVAEGAQAGAGSGSAVSLTTEQTPKFAFDLAQTLTQGSPSGGGHPQCVVTGPHAVMASGCANAETTDGSFSPTLTCIHDGPPIMAFSKSRRAQSADDYETWKQTGVANTVNCFDIGDVRTTEVVVGFAQNTRDDVRLQGGDGQICGALSAQPGMKQTTYLATSSAVRRLTPIECERLQGFPDGHTAIPWRGKPADECPDGPRYKALGNSMAVPVMRWIGARIDAVLNDKPFTYGIPEAFRMEVESR